MICKILEEREEAWFELASIEFISSSLMLEIHGTWAAGGGSTQLSCAFTDVYAIPIGNEHGKRLIIENGHPGLARWRDFVKNQFSTRRLALRGNILCMSAVYYAAMTVGLPELELLSKSEVRRRFAEYLRNIPDQLHLPSVARNVANVAQQLEVLDSILSDEVNLIFARNFQIEEHQYNLTWSCGWYLHLLTEARYLAPTNQSLKRFSEENARYEVIASAVLGDSVVGFSKPATGHLIATLNDVASWLIQYAKACEPEITEYLRVEAAQHQCALMGLSDRIKSHASLREKLLRRLIALLKRNQLHALYLPRVSDILFEVNDVIRYTFAIPAERYASVLRDIIEKIEAKYLRKVAIHNFWGRGTTFCAVNAYVPTVPVPFEIQFHTEQSARTKSGVSHGVYSGFRKLEPSTAKLVLYKRLIEIWQSVEVPVGVGTLGVPDPMVDPFMDQMLAIDQLFESGEHLSRRRYVTDWLEV